ncbi:MAG: DNA polymerase I, partial [Proteobacteria bacterium]|nr:DNA polymerase I [Pseudomonadota bacterium]
MTDLVLIDGSSYLYRAYYATERQGLANSNGEPTGAIHVVLAMIRKLIREERPTHVAIVFDAPGKTFRDELYPEYKATRPPMPDDLRSQVRPIIQAVEAMGLPLLQVDGVEADDVIGTLCAEAERAGLAVLVSTGDKDLAQLVTDGVTLIDTMNDTRIDRGAVKAKFDVWPEQIVDYLALVGDSSDNIPGVPKVGPKTAAKWLQLFDDADGIVEHGEEIKGKVGENLRDNVESLRLSQALATIRRDVELDVSIDELKAGDGDAGALRELYAHYELRSLLRQLDEEAGTAPEPQAEDERTGYETVLDWKAFDAWLEKIGNAALVAFDTETDSLDYMSARIVGFSLAVAEGDACYVPVAHDYPGAPDQLPRDEVLGKLKPWLEDDAQKKVGHHLKYDAHILARYGIGMR